VEKRGQAIAAQAGEGGENFDIVLPTRRLRARKSSNDPSTGLDFSIMFR
jgi:hypothetical protein